MFTTHKTKEEFYAWWKQQDHKKHTCGDMLLFTLMKSHWKAVDFCPELSDGVTLDQEMINDLKRAFKKHKSIGYRTPILALEHLKYSLKWKVRYAYNTFGTVLASCEGQAIHVATSRIQNAIDALENREEAANGA